jgi:hypothetical protein
MDRLFVEHCRVELMKVPSGLQEIDQAYRVSDNTLAPTALLGDILCCVEMSATDALQWPRLAVIHFPNGYCKLVRLRPSKPYLWATAVRFIIRN